MRAFVRQKVNKARDGRNRKRILVAGDLNGFDPDREDMGLSCWTAPTRQNSCLNMVWSDVSWSFGSLPGLGSGDYFTINHDILVVSRSVAQEKRKMVRIERRDLSNPVLESFDHRLRQSRSMISCVQRCLSNLGRRGTERS